MSITIAINLSVLLFLELQNPLITPPYPTEQFRILDSYITILIYLGILSILTLSAKNNYKQQYERAQESDKLKSAFLANMSHEIRTPLNAILGFSDLLAKREFSPEKKEQYSNLIKNNGKYLMKLVSDILDISLIESGQLTIENKKVELNDLFNRIYALNERSLKVAEKKDVKFILDMPNEKIWIHSDEFRVIQIITNFISNSIKFTNEGTIKIGFYKFKGQVTLFVEDTGCGISDEIREHIFNRFVKSEEEVNKEMNRGAGIGLSLSRELTILLGGTIWFESRVNIGSKFYVSLPELKEVTV